MNKIFIVFFYFFTYFLNISVFANVEYCTDTKWKKYGSIGIYFQHLTGFDSTQYDPWGLKEYNENQIKEYKEWCDRPKKQNEIKLINQFSFIYKMHEIEIKKKYSPSLKEMWKDTKKIKKLLNSNDLKIKVFLELFNENGDLETVFQGFQIAENELNEIIEIEKNKKKLKEKREKQIKIFFENIADKVSKYFVYIILVVLIFLLIYYIKKNKLNIIDKMKLDTPKSIILAALILVIGYFSFYQYERYMLRKDCLAMLQGKAKESAIAFCIRQKGKMKK